MTGSYLSINRSLIDGHGCNSSVQLRFNGIPRGRRLFQRIAELDSETENEVGFYIELPCLLGKFKTNGVVISE